jgi:hypothetical protein
MAEIVFEDSAFRFTDPIRVFKANDPYYFEVDNIPLAQLQENCLWLKDQLTTKVQEKLQNIKRSDIDELKPYSTGGDRKVRVKPGRYSARINDVASKKPLQYLGQVLGLFGSQDVAGWNALTYNKLLSPGSTADSAVLAGALDNFKDVNKANALNMNGLAERAFTWPATNPTNPVNGAGVALSNESTYEPPFDKVPFLTRQALLWFSTTFYGDFFAGTYDIGNENIGFGLLPRTESQWVKKWRGVARTAIVDIPKELSIEIPKYDSKDFYYINTEGTKVTLPAQNRIDMVFIYSKPVDANSASTLKNLTVAEGEAQPTVITKAELGVVRGAGIGASFHQKNDVDSDYTPVTSVDSQGNQMILPSIGDSQELATQYGFLESSGNNVSQNIVGSFPAPDDILNIAPLLSEKLESNAVELLGQSILPVAYVFVTNPGSEGVTQVVLNSDIIDIRPFFRTTELAYNERAGIAAAMPQLSLANPAVGKAELDTKIWELKKYIDGSNTTAAAQKEISVLAAGYIIGGTTFGPEAALADYYTKFKNVASYGAAIDQVAKKYGFGNQNAAATGPPAFSLPALPQWDIAKWAENNATDYPNPGKSANDYITIFANQSTCNNLTEATQVADQVEYSIIAGSKLDMTTAGSLGGEEPRLEKFGNQTVGHLQHQGGNGNLNNWITFGVISKKINFVREEYPWLGDYSVDIQFINCVPQTYMGGGNNETPRERKATYTGWWIEKGWDYFTIYISVGAPGSWTESMTPTTGNNFPSQNRDDAAKWSNFIVMSDEVMHQDTDFINEGTDPNVWSFQGNIKAGVCTVPTVMWKLTGIPSTSPNFYPSLGTPATIKLKNS